MEGFRDKWLANLLSLMACQFWLMFMCAINNAGISDIL